jgi:hypothetical protein
MNAYGIPRFDAGAEGIHLLWTWPDVLPLSAHGYDIQRLEYRRLDTKGTCETITPPIVNVLERIGEYPAPLGLLRLQNGSTFVPMWDVAFGDTIVAGAKRMPYIAVEKLLAFIQELATPTDIAMVETHQPAIVIATSRGKAVATKAGDGTQSIVLTAPSIDTIYIYVLSLRFQEMTICTETQVVPESMWARAPYLVKGLTLPIHEADPTLASPAQEYAAAKSRLVGSEMLQQSDFEKFVATVRAPVAAQSLGRSGQRIVLTRPDPSQVFEELTLNQQLSALCVHPKLRRVLGFGYADRRDLTVGSTYLYRITGRFEMSDVEDAIYDFHLMPSSTVLPAAFNIGTLGLRFQVPVKVVLDPAPPSTDVNATSRRGILIDTTGFDDSWLLPSFGPWSAVFDFPTPVSKIELEVDPNHSFSYAGGDPWNWLSTTLHPLPSGGRVELTFAQPISQLRLAGTGIFFALRIPSGSTGIKEISVVTPPILYDPEALPLPPIALTIDNLQEPPATITGPIDESTAVQPRPPEGFKLSWLPETASAFPIWPTDIDAGPPLDAIAYVIDHRTVELPSTYGNWEPIQGDDNITVGSRDTVGTDVTLTNGCDLATLFPEVRPRSADAGFALHLSDVFGQTDPSTGEVRPAQPYGSYHQYEIRAVDAVGRISATATLSNVERLEKHVPPPMPVVPHAKAIVKGAPGLTSDDIALLGSHDNAILLEWGWRDDLRDIDPETAEFRVYSTAPPDVIHATVTGVTTVSSNWQLSVTADLPLVASELVGLWITTGGYPFQIVQNGSGTSTTIVVEPSLLQPARAPAVGPVIFGRTLAPQHQNPGAWDQRVAIYPLGAADAYRHVFYDVLTLTLAHPRDALWVGVSAADAQSYVPDQRASGANANRPGNESGIAVCTIDARYQGQPVFSVPPPLGDVPEIVTDEPTGRSILVTFDISSLLGGALPPGAPIAVERCSADDVTSALSTSGGQVHLSNPDGSQQTIVFPNPGDEAAVVATLSSSNPQRLANKYILYILGASNDTRAFFDRISSKLDQVGTFTDRLAPKPGRFYYFVRAADALGHLSDGGALLPIAIRVPSVALGTRPVMQSVRATSSGASLVVAVPADDDTVSALLFAAIAPAGADPPVQGEADILRIPNRRDLYPNDGIRLLLSDGTLLAPSFVKSLGDADVQIAADGSRVAKLTVSASSGVWATLWCYSITNDGFPSHACGPFGIGIGP